MTSFSSTARLTDAEILEKFHEWAMGVMLTCGGKDTYHTDGTGTKGLFEGFRPPGLEELNSQDERQYSSKHKEA